MSVSITLLGFRDLLHKVRRRLVQLLAFASFIVAVPSTLKPNPNPVPLNFPPPPYHTVYYASYLY